MSEPEVLYEMAENAAPLISWDITMEAYHRLLYLAGDANDLKKLSTTKQWQHSFSFDKALLSLNRTILVTDTEQTIVFASTNIFEMNGYKSEEVIGKKPAMFQGEKTAADTKKYIRGCVEKRIPFEASIWNYRKNGSLYECFIKGFPLFNHKKELANFIAFEHVA